MNSSRTLTVALIVFIAIFASIGAIATILNPNFVFQFLPGDATYVPGGTFYNVTYILLTIATDLLYIIGGAVVFFGGIHAAVKFLQIKLQDPDQPSEVSRRLSGYLNLGLAFFIGAEIVKTVVVRTVDEFALLIIVILSRGLFSLILYLERRWHGTTPSE
jgi:uncharacterized membrane protein